MQAMSLTKIGYSVKGRICLLCLCLSLIFRSNLCKSAFCLCPVLFVLWYMDFDYFYVCVHVSLTVSQHGFLGLTISQFYVITRQSYVHDNWIHLDGDSSQFNLSLVIKVPWPNRIGSAHFFLHFHLLDTQHHANHRLAQWCCQPNFSTKRAPSATTMQASTMALRVDFTWQ